MMHGLALTILVALGISCIIIGATEAEDGGPITGVIIGAALLTIAWWIS